MTFSDEGTVSKAGLKFKVSNYITLLHKIVKVIMNFDYKAKHDA